MLINACKNKGLAVRIVKTKCLDVARHRDIMANNHITVGSNSYEIVENFTYLRSFLRNINYIHEQLRWNVDLKQEFHVIIQSTNICPLDLSLGNWKLKYIKYHYCQVCYLIVKHCLLLWVQFRLKVFENQTLMLLFEHKIGWECRMEKIS